jgi:hypothetical protein
MRHDLQKCCFFVIAIPFVPYIEILESPRFFMLCPLNNFDLPNLICM